MSFFSGFCRSILLALFAGLTFSTTGRLATAAPPATFCNPINIDYGPYGELTEINGQTQPDFAYTRLFYHKRSGLDFAEYRAFDSGLKRWLNRDPIGEGGGIDLYGYVDNVPVAATDEQGRAVLLQPDKPLTPGAKVR